MCHTMCLFMLHVSFCQIRLFDDNRDNRRSNSIVPIVENTTHLSKCSSDGYAIATEMKYKTENVNIKNCSL